MRAEWIDPETGEIHVAEPASSAEFSRQVDSLDGLWTKAFTAYGEDPDNSGVTMQATGVHLTWRLAADCERPKIAHLAERPRGGGDGARVIPGREATIYARCKRCEPCMSFRRRLYRTAIRAELMLGVEAGNGAFDVPGTRAWWCTFTFDALALARIERKAWAAMDEAASKAKASFDALMLRVDEYEASVARARALRLRDPIPDDDVRRARFDREAARAAIFRRFMAPACEQSRKPLFPAWVERMAEHEVAECFRRLRKNGQERKLGQLPLVKAYVFERGAQYGRPHLHALIHERGVPIAEAMIQHAWKRRADGAKSGGADPRAAMFGIGHVKAKLVTGDVPGQSADRDPTESDVRFVAAYLAKYAVKQDGVKLRRSRGYGDAREDHERADVIARVWLRLREWASHAPLEGVGSGWRRGIEAAIPGVLSVFDGATRRRPIRRASGFAVDDCAAPAAGHACAVC